jgi:hypothetical protein
MEGVQANMNIMHIAILSLPINNIMTMVGLLSG